MNLLHRLEQASVENQKLFVEVYDALYRDGGTPWASDACHRERFMFLIHWDAYMEAAMLLVDRRALWVIGSMEDGPIARLCWPMPNGGFVGGYVEAKAATATIALCIALLKARALNDPV